MNSSGWMRSWSPTGPPDGSLMSPPNGASPPAIDDVVAVNGVHSSRHGVDHVAIPAGRNDPSIVMLRHQLDAEVRLVPDLPVPHPRQTSVGPAVPSSKCRRKVRKRRRARSDRSIIGPLLLPVLRPRGRPLDVYERAQAFRADRPNFLIDRAPLVSRVPGILRAEACRTCFPAGRDERPGKKDSDETRTRTAHSVKRYRLVRPSERRRIEKAGHERPRHDGGGRCVSISTGDRRGSKGDRGERRGASNGANEDCGGETFQRSGIVAGTSKP